MTTCSPLARLPIEAPCLASIQVMYASHRTVAMSKGGPPILIQKSPFDEPMPP
jgi:hypothetical protein